MELIKQIRQAETDSKQIIAQARTESAQIIAKAAAEHSRKLEQADLDRNETIKKAVSQAKIEGLAEAQQLKARAEQSLEDLGNKANKRIASAVAKIVEAVKALAH